MPERPQPSPQPPSRLEDIHRSEQTMVQVRWAAVVFATVQVLAYDDVPYPPGFRTAALLLTLPLEGPIRFGLAGPRAAWGAGTALSTLGGLGGSRQYDYPFLWNSV